MPVIIILLILNEQLRLIFRTSPSQYELACPAELLDDAPYRFCVQVRATNFPWSTWGRLFPLQESRFHESLDGTMTNATQPSRFIQAHSVSISERASLADNRMVFARRCHAVLIPAVSFAGDITQAVQHRRNLVVAVADRHPANHLQRLHRSRGLGRRARTIHLQLRTLWKGRPVATASMYFALGSVALLVIGGLSGVFTGIIPVDWQAHSTYYVVAHIHYVLIGSNLFPVFAGFYYWLPKMTGRMLNERLGKWSFWVMFVGFNVGFFPMHIVGLLGMPRRIYTYAPELGLGSLNETMTAGAFVLGIGILILLVSLQDGPLAGKNPWNSDGLEWGTDSPPKPYGTVHIPTVVSRHPLWDEHEEEEDPYNDRLLDEARLTLTTTWLDAQPRSVATMPDNTLLPLLSSITLFICFLFVVFQMMWAALAGLAATLLIFGIWMWPRPMKGESVSSTVYVPSHHGEATRQWPVDDRRGLHAMYTVIATEFSLFVCLFASYYYLGSNKRLNGRSISLRRCIWL